VGASEYQETTQDYLLRPNDHDKTDKLLARCREGFKAALLSASVLRGGDGWTALAERFTEPIAVIA
jgi:hypothetical protein